MTTRQFTTSDLNYSHYNGLDSAITLQCWNEIEPDLGLYRSTYDFTQRLIEPLMFMMTKGIMVDHDKLKVVKEDTNVRINEKQLELNRLAGRELNPNSPKDVQAYFYIEKGVPPYTKPVKVGGRTESRVTTDDKAMQRLARGTSTRPGFKEAKLIQELRGLRKLLGTYLEINFDADGRFHYSANPRGTRFGRISTGKTVFETGMNLQNLPPAFKKFLRADPGYILVEMDKAKAEWVVVAYMSGDANMIKVIEEHLDPHIHTAHLMTGLPKEIIEMEEKEVGHTTDEGEVREGRFKIEQKFGDVFQRAKFLPRNMSIRQCGKKSNHGLNYDEGFRTFALTNEMLEGDAKKIIELYKFVAYPGIPHWHESIQSQLRKNRTLTNCYGRMYKFLDQWGPDLFKAGYAFGPQSTVADNVNDGIIKTYYDDDPCLAPLELLGQVHDSILFQFPIAQLDFLMDAVHKIKNYLEPTLSYNGRDFVIETDAKIGIYWGDMKDLPFTISREQLGRLIGELEVSQ